MKRILALLLVLLIATLSACGDETATKKKKKKVVIIEKRPQSSQTDTASEESNASDFTTGDSQDVTSSSVLTPREAARMVEKKTSADIGKNYYRVKVIQEHPGVPGMDAEYQMTAVESKEYILM